MTKITWLRITNLMLVASFLVQASTGLSLIIRPSNAAYEIHEYNGIIFLLLAAAHIFLNWNWIRANYFKK